MFMKHRNCLPLPHFMGFILIERVSQRTSKIEIFGNILVQGILLGRLIDDRMHDI